jgi:hypothetical protein
MVIIIIKTKISYGRLLEQQRQTLLRFRAIAARIARGSLLAGEAVPDFRKAS